MLTFDPVAHEYRLNGNVLPSVTQVIGAVWPELYAHSSDYARDRGSRVHEAIDEDLRTGAEDWTLSTEIQGYVAAARRVVAELELEIVSVEQRLWSDTYRYAGTLDIVARRNGKLLLLDWKTGDPGWQCGLQTAAYAHALQERDGIVVTKRVGCHLRSDGSYDLTQYNNFRSDFADFCAALRVFRRKAA